MSALRLPLLLCLGLSFACESESTKNADGEKADDSTKADTKEADAEPGKKADAKKAEKHFDVAADKSGVLARSAAALDVDEGVDTSDALHGLSHHAEKLPSVQKLCAKMKELGSVEDEKACASQSEHKVVLIGPEVYAQWAACVMDSTSKDDVKICDEAEAEAETLLHGKPHGDGLSKEDCTTLFETFEKFAMVDAGAHAEHVKEVLEEVRDDVVTSCMDQGTKAELECAKTSKTLVELNECASAHL
ncbi:MAG: hypothetical protein ACE37F_23445 [Nannocystaceae bacterium]|nr:hypothetical protein [bacterium]